MALRHQIVLIGRRLETALVGIKEFNPDKVCFLYTDITRDIFPPLVKMLPEGTLVESYEIDPYDTGEIITLAEKIRQGIQDGDIVSFNVTEGTKVAFVALWSVAAKYGDDVLYYSQEGEAINIAKRSRRDIEARISNEEFCTLFGNELADYQLVSNMLPIDVATARNVKQFIERNAKTFQRIQHQYRRDFGGRIENLPESFRIEREKSMSISISSGALSITDKGRDIFRDSNPNASRLFFSGRWWEVLVSDAVYRWDVKRHRNPGDSQVWRNVEFRGKTKGRTKNELDILVNDRRRLIFIECKSGYISQENIYKIDGVRDTYGGWNSKSVLVSYYPLDEDLVQKCKDLHIYYFAPETPQDRISHLDGIGEWLDAVVKEYE